MNSEFQMDFNQFLSSLSLRGKKGFFEGNEEDFIFFFLLLAEHLCSPQAEWWEADRPGGEVIGSRGSLMRSLRHAGSGIPQARFPVPPLPLTLCDTFIQLLKISGAPLPRVDNNTYVTGLL